MLAVTKLLSQQNYVCRNKTLSWQTCVCHDNHNFVTTKHMFCRSHTLLLVVLAFSNGIKINERNVPHHNSGCQDRGWMTVMCCVIQNGCCVLSCTDTVIVKLWDSTVLNGDCYVLCDTEWLLCVVWYWHSDSKVMGQYCVKQLSQNFPSKKMFPGKLILFSVSDLKNKTKINMFCCVCVVWACLCVCVCLHMRIFVHFCFQVVA